MDETNVKTLLERVFIFLEDGEWEKADEYCERVLDAEPTNATAYLGKLLAEIKVPAVEKLADYKVSFENSKYYQRIVKYGDEELNAKLKGYIEHIKLRQQETAEKERQLAEEKGKEKEKEAN